VNIRLSEKSDAERLAMKRVLIADDTDSSRELLRFILEDMGHHVVEAEDREQAIAKAIAIELHLVILDLNMPGMDGYTTAAALRRIPACKTMPIVALTATLSDSMPARLIQAGFNGHLVKPIKPSLLRQYVGSLL